MFLRPIEVAKALSISKSKIYELIARNEIPSVRIGGGCLRIPRAAIERLASDAMKADAGEVRESR
jgi:excisionase family DNA binding protein